MGAAKNIFGRAWQAKFPRFSESQNFSKRALIVYSALVHACIVTLVGYTLRVRRKASLS